MFSKSQRGFGLLPVLLVVLLVGAMGGVGWYVWDKQKDEKPAITNFEECAAAGNPIMESYPEQCRANGQTFINTKQANESNLPSQSDIEKADAKIIKFSELPNDLKLVALVKITELAPPCVKDGQLVDYAGEVIDPEVKYAEVGSAIIGIGCDSGAAGLFAVDYKLDQGNKWLFVLATQELFTCDVVFSHPIPKKLLELGGREAECYEESMEQNRTYEQASQARFY